MENTETRIARDLENTNEQQHTGNHNDAGPDVFGGTRAGAGNVERPVASVQKATDVDRAAPLDQAILNEDVSVNGAAEQSPERDERGMI